jgi:tetratricopeptide (TPR) repeat protein
MKFLNPRNHPGLFRFLLMAFFIGCSCNDLFSQAGNKADQETLNLINSVDNEAGGTGAVIILKEYETTIDAKGSVTLVLKILGKIYNNQALEAYSHIPMGYSSYYEEPVLDFARVIKKDGTTIEVRKDAIQIKTTPDFEGDTKYSDNRYLTFAFSGLEIGAVFEYKATFKQKRPVIDGEWFDNHYFGGMLQNLAPPYIPRTDPVIRSVYRLRVPKDFAFTYHISKNPVQPVKSIVNNNDVYTWEYAGLPSLKIEASMPPLSRLSPVLLISTISDWRKIDEWATGKLNAGAQITPAFKEKVKEVVGGTATREEKIQAIINYISKNIRYVYADLNRGGYEPHSLTEIISSMYGDCKDQGMLLVSMLKEAGIEAYPALINPYPADEFTDVPAPFFLHLITCIPGQKDTTWFDMTSRVSDFYELAAADQNRAAFVVNGKGGLLTRTPSSSSSSNTAIFDVRCGFNKANAEISLSIRTSGVESEMLKAAFITASDDERKEFIKSLIKNYVQKPQFESIGFSDLHNANTGFSSNIKYHLDSILQKEQAVFNFTGHAMMPLAFFAGIESRSLPESRVNDLVSEFAYTIKSSEEYSPPERCPILISLPENESISNEFFEFRKSFSKEGSSTIVNWELHFERMVIPKEKYLSYINAIRKLEEMATWEITYADPLSLVRNFQNEDSRSIMMECNEMLTKDRKNILALLLKGYYFNKLSVRDSSIAVLSNVLRIDPGNKYAHLWITQPLFSLKRNTEALAHYEKALLADPFFEEVYLSRGAWYMMQSQKDKGIADLRKAVEVNPANNIAWQILGLYYAQENKYKEAIEFSRNAIKIDSVNTNAYELLAESYMKVKSYREAENAYKKAIELNPGNGVLYGNLGWTYYLMDDFQKCLELSDKAVSIDPELLYARLNIALTHLRTGNIEEANRLYSELLKEKTKMSPAVIFGAIQDLRDLKAKGIYAREADRIIKSLQ